MSDTHVITPYPTGHLVRSRGYGFGGAKRNVGVIPTVGEWLICVGDDTLLHAPACCFRRDEKFFHKIIHKNLQSRIKLLILRCISLAEVRYGPRGRV